MTEPITVPDVPAPTAVLCWKQSRAMVRCDRKAGHGGRHSWEHERAEAPVAEQSVYESCQCPAKPGEPCPLSERDCSDRVKKALAVRYLDRATKLSGCAWRCHLHFVLQGFDACCSHCQNIALAMVDAMTDGRYLSLTQRAEAIAPPDEKVQVPEDDQSRSDTPEISNRLQSSAPTDVGVTTPAPNKAKCLDCGLDYVGFDLDVLLPRWQWLLIHPDEGGLLCARCIVARASRLPGAVALHAVIGIAPPKESK